MSRKRKKIQGRRNRNKWSTKKKLILSTVGVFAVLICLLLTGYLWIKSRVYSGLGSTLSPDNTEYSEVSGITNVLLIGTDARTLDEKSRADSIIIATLDNNLKEIKLTSLFRDTLVNIPGYGEGKLNAALAYGGPKLLLETIKDTYDIKIDKYVIINFWGFEAIIDQMGGLELNVEDYMMDELNRCIGESTGGNDCPITEPGLQVLNGKQALSYARIRKGVGDEFARTDRQREVIMKVAEKLKETKPSKYLGIMNKMLDYIETNIDPIQALNMAYTIYKFPTLEIEQLQIPIPELSEGRLYKNLGWVFLMDRKQNSEILKKFIFEDKVTEKEEYDYESLREALNNYKLEENGYNINPEDYEDNNVEIIQPPKQDNNSENQNNGQNSGGSIEEDKNENDSGSQSGGTNGSGEENLEGNKPQNPGSNQENQNGSSGENQGENDGVNQGGSSEGDQSENSGENQDGNTEEGQGGVNEGDKNENIEGEKPPINSDANQETQP